MAFEIRYVIYEVVGFNLIEPTDNGSNIFSHWGYDSQEQALEEITKANKHYSFTPTSCVILPKVIAVTTEQDIEKWANIRKRDGISGNR